MATSFKLSMDLTARLGSSVKSAFQSADARLNNLGKSIGKYKKQQRTIEKFNMDSVAIGTTRSKLLETRKEIARLAKGIQKNEQPTKSMEKQLGRARKTADQLTDRLEKQRARLETHRRALNQAGISTRNLSTENERVGRSLDKLNGKYQNVIKSIRKQKELSAKRSEVRGQIFDTVAVGASIAAPLTIAFDFEESVERLKAISRSDDPILEKTARDLGKSTAFSATEVVSGMTLLGQAGFKANQIVNATPGLLDLATASGADLATTADIATNVLSAFGKKSSEMTEVSDILATTFTSTNTTLQSLGDTMRFVGATASSLNIPLSDVAAMTGLLGDVGIPGSNAGTALRASMLRLTKPTAAAQKILKKLNVGLVEMVDGKENLRSMTEIVRDLALSTEDMGTKERTAAIAEIFGVEATTAMTTLFEKALIQTNEEGKKTIPLLDKIIELQTESKGRAREIAAAIEDTTKGRLRELGSALEAVSISIGQAVSPIVKEGAVFLAEYVSKLSTVIETYPKITVGILSVIGGVVALKAVVLGSIFVYTVYRSSLLLMGRAAMGTLRAILWLGKSIFSTSVISTLAAARIKMMTAVQWLWNAALTANPIGIVVVGIGALIGAGIYLVKNWETVKTFFSEFWESLKVMTGKAVNWIRDNIVYLLNPFSMVYKVVSTIGELIASDEASIKVVANKVDSATSRLVPQSQENTFAPNFGQSNTALPNVPNASLIQNRQQVNIDAPFTINAAPGMNEKDIANEVHKGFMEREARAAEATRAAMFDIDPF